jgi:hypothetical protein
MENRERLLTSVCCALLVGLALLLSAGAASADSIVCGSPTTTACPPVSDSRGDFPAHTGTVTEVRYGPFTVGANSAVHNAIDLSAPAPCTNCYITDIIPSLIYEGDANNTDGTVANLTNGMMMHHFVLLHPNRTDPVCPNGLDTNIFGTSYERFFASGNERTHLHLPSPYGYHNTSSTWPLIYHLVNKSGVQKKVSIQLIMRWRNDSNAAETKPLWLDIDGCGDSEYTIPTGYSDTHDPRTGAAGQYGWVSTVTGRMVAISGHLHDVDITGPAPCDTHCANEGGGIAVSAELVGGSPDYYGPVPPDNPPPADLTGTTMCRSEGYYGTTWAGTQFKGHLDTMSACGIQTELPAGHQAEAYPTGGAYPLAGIPFSSGQVIKLHTEYENDTGSQQTDVMGIMVGWYVPSGAGYPRPRGATPLRSSLAVAYNQCVSPNRTHGAPLSSGSCNPPVQSSASLTVGTGDAWPGTVPNSVSSVRYDVVPDVSATTADESNVRVVVNATDVRKRSDLTDYTGQLKASTVLRITDRDNGPSEVGTATDTSFSFTVPCAATGDTAIGSACVLNTTANSVTPGSVKGGKRTIWQFGKVDLFDGGTDGVASTEPNTLFETEGVFVP